MENKFDIYYLYGEDAPPVLKNGDPFGFGGKFIFAKDNDGYHYIVGSLYDNSEYDLKADPHWKVLDMNINVAKNGLPRHFSYFPINNKSVAIYMPDNEINSKSYNYTSLNRYKLNVIEEMRLDEGTLRMRQINQENLKEQQEIQKNRKKLLNDQKDILRKLKDELKKLIQNKDRAVRSIRREEFGDKAEAIYNQQNQLISNEIVMLTTSITIYEKNIEKIDIDLKNIQDQIKYLKSRSK